MGFFYGTIGWREGLFLRYYNGLVFVSEPGVTWTVKRCEKGPKVENYRPVDVEIVTRNIQE